MSSLMRLSMPTLDVMRNHVPSTLQTYSRHFCKDCYDNDDISVSSCSFDICRVKMSVMKGAINLVIDILD